MAPDDGRRRPQPAARLVVDARRALRPGWRAALAWLALCAPGCGSGHPHEARPQPLPLSVRASADTAGMAHLEIRPPRPARAWLARVIPAPPGMLSPPLPEAGPDSVPSLPETPPALAVGAGLMPPVLRAAAPLVLPRGREPSGPGRFEAVELDVRVSETGEVTDVIGVGGSADSALIESASACARRMRFYPARRGGEPVAVWCRQRFEFGPGGAARP
jgi:TonB family protein